MTEKTRSTDFTHAVRHRNGTAANTANGRTTGKTTGNTTGWVLAPVRACIASGFGRVMRPTALGAMVLAVSLSAGFAATILPHAAMAQATGEPTAKGSKADQQTIDRIESYLDDITTLKADFVQISSDGGASDGVVYMQRPGKMRFEYNPPAQILLISTGHDFIYYDKEINAPTYFNIDETPAGIILAEHVSLTRDVKIVDFKRTAETLRVQLVRKADPGAGSVTLVFQENPMQLRQWIVTDPAGIDTTVTLFNTVEGIALDPALFKFDRVWPGQNK